jgi:hypothetical protein
MQGIEPLKTYYYALYAKACVDITPGDYPDEWDELTFYDKTFFCAHIRPSTYENLSFDDMETLACLDVEEQLQTKLISGNESIEDLCESAIVCFDPVTGKEIDVFDLMNPKGFSCNWTESGIIKFGVWINESDLPK